MITNIKHLCVIQDVYLELKIIGSYLMIITIFEGLLCIQHLFFHHFCWSSVKSLGVKTSLYGQRLDICF